MPALTSFPNSTDIAREVLPNGMIVLARENFSSKAVVISGSFTSGSLDEAEMQQGLSSLMAGSLMRGTLSRDFDTLHETLESMGMSLGIGGGTHTSSFGGKSLAEDLPLLLELLSDALRNPAFPEAQVERLRGEILTGLKIRQQDTRAVAGDAFRALCYPKDHPYSRGSAAEFETIPTLTLDDLNEFHRAHVSPHGMILVIVGAVAREDAIRLSREAFGDWILPSNVRAPLPAAPALNKPRRESRALSGKSQSDVILGWPGPARAALDYHPANLANMVLGVFGMMGRLGKVVREDQGLAYHCGSRISGGHGPGPWQITAGVNPVNIDTAVTSMLHEVERITDELVSENELADVKANLIGRLPLNLESNEGVAGTIQSIETYGLGLDYLLGYADMLNAITREQVQAAAHRYLNPRAYALAIAGP